MIAIAQPRAKRKAVLVLARAGDPARKEGRARLIWAANTAHALGEMGYDAHLACRDGFSFWPQRWLSPVRSMAPAPELQAFYNVGDFFKVATVTLPGFLKWRSAEYLESGDFETRFYYDRFILPRFDVVHTRDWRVVQLAVRRNIPTIYEDHHESFCEEIERYDAETVNHPAFRLAVAVSEYVGEVMARKGIPAERVMVEGSGVSSASFRRQDESTKQAFRERWLEDGRYERLVAYAGGLHPIRGIDMLLDAAAALPRARFLIAGGRGRQAGEWRRIANKRALGNVSFLGYLAQRDIPLLLQSADALALPYRDASTSRITSPLKFFEYLCAERPIAACLLPALQPYENDARVNVQWAAIGDTESFCNALRASLASARTATIEPRHLEIAAAFSWAARQERILARAGLSPAAEPVSR